MSGFVGFMNNILYKPYIVPLFLIAVGIYFTIRTKGVQIRMFKEMFKVVSEKPADEKGISSFGALMVSTASRVGTGNIIGVCTAIILGGPGAIFWMWITAIFGGAKRTFVLHAERSRPEMARRALLGTDHLHICRRLQHARCLQPAVDIRNIQLL